MTENLKKGFQMLVMWMYSLIMGITCDERTSECGYVKENNILNIKVKQETPETYYVFLADKKFVLPEIKRKYFDSG